MTSAYNWKHSPTACLAFHYQSPWFPLPARNIDQCKRKWKTSAELHCMESQYPDSLWAWQHRAHGAHQEKALIISSLREELSWAHVQCVHLAWGQELPHSPWSPPRESLWTLFTEFFNLREREWAHKNQQSWRGLHGAHLGESHLLLRDFIFPYNLPLLLWYKRTSFPHMGVASLWVCGNQVLTT